MFVCEILSVSWSALVRPLRSRDLFGSDGMCPRIAKPKSCSGLLGDEFVGRFDNRADWIAYHAGVFPVGVIDSPELLAGLQSRARFHGDSSPKTERAKMYQLHKIRGQS